jgi:lysophospholipase L1-like esterase
MMPINNKFAQLAGVVITCAVISACSQDVSNPPPLNSGTASSGDADFTTFVSIGDSLTAGYADGTLYLLGQQNSFPLMLAQQFAAADDVVVSFEQPLLAHDLQAGIDGNLGSLLIGGVADEIKNRFVLNTETQTPERLATPDGAVIQDVVGTGLNGTTFNNMGVPGAKSFHLGSDKYGDFNFLATKEANPYFVRFSTANNSTVIGDAAVQQPSFVTMWIGNNDILSYATAGGAGIDQLGNNDPSTYGSNDITDPIVFADTYAGLVGALKANPAVQGVLINIPDVSTIPYFTTVPYNPVPLDQASADGLNAAYAEYNGGVQAALGAQQITAEEAAQRTITFAEGQNAVVLIDEYLSTGPDAPLSLLPQMRQATANDLVVLPTSSIIGELVDPLDDPEDPASPRWGVSAPLGDQDVLLPQELALINTARVAFNTTIKGTADADANLVFLDAAALMTQLSESGINYGTGSITADFATGGGFSLDGVHPTARGYAVIANAIVDTINTGFSANVHKVDPATYPTVFLK